MDRKYIEAEHIVDRYLSGDLTVREAREFEHYCLEHPEALKAMPIPVRLKARLARQPATDSETGVFKAIPSSATHAALEASDEGFDAEEEQREFSGGQSVGGNRAVFIGMAFALVAAVAGLIAYAVQANSLSRKVRDMERSARATQMQAAGSTSTYRVQLVRGKPAAPTLNLGWLTPPQWMDRARLESRAAPHVEFVGLRTRGVFVQGRRLQLARADGSSGLAADRAAVRT
jgi:hypothetical protein